jgi:Putative metal-binding motif
VPALRRFLPGIFLGLLVGAVAFASGACGSDAVKSPFGPAAGGAGGEGGQGDAGFRLDIDAGSEVDPTLGGPCEDDGQCDDDVKCTVDRCDLDLQRCRFVPDDTGCDNGIYCDGSERCDVRDDCVAGDVVACSDNISCTIDVCVEATQSCERAPRDADGDGDPTRNCGGQDCDDTLPQVSSLATEVCGNSRDDNCDGAVDEAGCTSPEYDTCQTALQVTEPGYYDIDLTATKLDYPTECAGNLDVYREAVMLITVPEGGPFDLDVTAKRDSGDLSLGTADACGHAASATCEESFEAPGGESVARWLLRAPAPGVYPVYVDSATEGMVQVHVQLRDAEPMPGDLCEDAVTLEPGGAPQLLRLPGYAADVASECEPLTGDGFVRFSLDTASDVTLIAEAQSGLGLPVIALFDAKCKTELTCRHSQPGRLFVRDLPPGDYRVMVASDGPDDVSIRLETGPVSEAPPGEGCDDAQPLENGVEQLVDLSDHEDAVNAKCLAGAPDSTFEFELAGTRDVALIGRFSDGDLGAISFGNDTCSAALACRQGTSVVRQVRYGVSAGTYRALIESARGNPVGLSWFERPAVAPLNVPFADDCQGVVKIPEQGGRFLGNTRNAFPDFVGGCDVGGQGEGGAPDQLLTLTLTQPRRVVLDMQGSAYETMLSVREGEFCPGIELQLGCAPGYRAGRSYLDLDLQAGQYFVQIDGYDGDSGAWQLDVFTAPL